MSTTTELDQLHELIGGLRRCVTSLASRYGDSAAMRRIVNDAERIQNDIDRLDIDAEELNLARGVSQHHHTRREDRHPRHAIRQRLLAGRGRRRPDDLRHSTDTQRTNRPIHDEVRENL